MKREESDLFAGDKEFDGLRADCKEIENNFKAFQSVISQGAPVYHNLAEYNKKVNKVVMQLYPKDSPYRAIATQVADVFAALASTFKEFSNFLLKFPPRIGTVAKQMDSSKPTIKKWEESKSQYAHYESKLRKLQHKSNQAKVKIPNYAEPAKEGERMSRNENKLKNAKDRYHVNNLTAIKELKDLIDRMNSGINPLFSEVIGTQLEKLRKVSSEFETLDKISRQFDKIEDRTRMEKEKQANQEQKDLVMQLKSVEFEKGKVNHLKATKSEDMTRESEFSSGGLSVGSLERKSKKKVQISDSDSRSSELSDDSADDSAGQTFVSISRSKTAKVLTEHQRTKPIQRTALEVGDMPSRSQGVSKPRRQLQSHGSANLSQTVKMPSGGGSLINSDPWSTMEMTTSSTTSNLHNRQSAPGGGQLRNQFATTHNMHATTMSSTTSASMALNGGGGNATAAVSGNQGWNSGHVRKEQDLQNLQNRNMANAMMSQNLANYIQQQQQLDYVNMMKKYKEEQEQMQATAALTESSPAKLSRGGSHTYGQEANVNRTQNPFDTYAEENQNADNKLSNPFR
mmetsp:Transcript_23131/g.26182  ORF Transcript_23131/g.26182 Transcript_23131/m.26182 type:complete len:570 (-) Transcript_23131:772-2481(-)